WREDEQAKAYELSNVAETQAQLGEFAEALETARQIKDAGLRAEALCEIAKTQAAVGKDEEGIKTMQLVLVGSDDAISQVAEVFVLKGAKDSFKQLLAPASYHISASYEMCGLLAQLYSDDEDVIDQIAALVMSGA